MKEGEATFLHHARLVQRYGATLVLMAFDEHGKADARARKIDICCLAYWLLTDTLNFLPEDIIFRRSLQYRRIQ